MENNKSKKVKIIAAVCIVLILAVIIALVVTQKDSKKTSGGENVATEESGSEKKTSEESDGEIIESEESAETEQENAATEKNVSEKEKSEKSAEEEQENAATEKNVSEKEKSEKSAETEPVLVERAEASYEEWLAAAALLGMTMQYPDYELKGIYLASETKLEEHSESKGIYIIFKSEGEKVALSIQPLDEERSEAGTNDLYTNDLGYATFDEINAEDVKTKKMTKVEVDDLTAVIEQTLLPTVCMH